MTNKIQDCEEEIAMKVVTVKITLGVPEDFRGVGQWSPKELLYDYICHWLEEGHCTNYLPDLPSGVVYEGFEIEGF